MIFADTYYYLALLSERDSGHEMAVEFSKDLRETLITTDWIVVELADACSGVDRRGRFLTMLEIMVDDEELTIVEATHDGLAAGIALFSQRPDKEWSLTDCISFVVMQEHGVTEALTADQHFEQAGFVPLLVV